jgi:hypothetical protein
LPWDVRSKGKETYFKMLAQQAQSEVKAMQVRELGNSEFKGVAKRDKVVLDPQCWCGRNPMMKKGLLTKRYYIFKNSINRWQTQKKGVLCYWEQRETERYTESKYSTKIDGGFTRFIEKSTLDVNSYIFFSSLQIYHGNK